MNLDLNIVVFIERERIEMTNDIWLMIFIAVITLMIIWEHYRYKKYDEQFNELMIIVHRLMYPDQEKEKFKDEIKTKVLEELKLNKNCGENCECHH